jgi:hypothetical protein
MEIKEFNLLRNKIIADDEVLTLTIYIELTTDLRKTIYKDWLIANGVNSPNSYIGNYINAIAASHSIFLFDITSESELKLTLPEEKLNIEEDIKKTRDCRSAYRKYRTFLQQVEATIASFEKPVTSEKIIKEKIQSEWPVWPQPSEQELYELALKITPFIKFLPAVLVKLVVEENEKLREELGPKFDEFGMDINYYLWPQSPCTFPGVRRYVANEISLLRKKGGRAAVGVYPEARLLDDNVFPKHIWSFLYRGKPFQNFGPSGYQLAHIFDHKTDSEERLNDELSVDKDKFVFQDYCLSGLFTSIANVCYVPKDFLKPTDHNSKLRNVIQQKVSDLYKDVCQVLPDGLLAVFPPETDPWHFTKFKWEESDLSDNDELKANPKKNLKAFFDYRHSYYNNNNSPVSIF